MESSWDIRSPSSPRSFCILEKQKGDNLLGLNNPFDEDGEASNSTFEMMYGTERGSLHTRKFDKLEGEGGTGAVISPIDQQSQLNQSVCKGNVVSIIPIRTSSSSSNNKKQQRVFLLLVDDNRGSSANTGLYASMIVSLRQHGSSSSISQITSKTPRMSCAAYHKSLGILYAAGKSLANLLPQVWENSNTKKGPPLKSIQIPNCFPSAVRAGPMALVLTSSAKVAVCAVNSTFYAVPLENPAVLVNLWTVEQSSQVHPILIKDIQDPTIDSSSWSSLILASGRQASIVDVQYIQNSEVHSLLRHACHLPSPILNLATHYPWISLLTSDGLISLRSPTCLPVPLRTIEVGTRPNDFFSVVGFYSQQNKRTYMASLSYSGDCRVFACLEDSQQDLADRLMRLSINAFGSSGFPRNQVAETLGASFSATSYVGPEPTQAAKQLLQEYLETILGLAEFISGAKAITGNQQQLSRDQILCATCLLCLVNPKKSLANRAAIKASQQVGVWFALSPTSNIKEPIVAVCDAVVEKLLREASTSFSLISSNTTAAAAVHPSNKTKASSGGAGGMELVETAAWLLRACGRHEQSIQVLYERKVADGSLGQRWSDIKYESHTATHLSELCTHGGVELVLGLQATKRLLERNPPLGLGVFLSLHPQNELQWRQMRARDDPIHKYPKEIVALLKQTVPAVSSTFEDDANDIHEESKDEMALPLDSGRALAVTFLESCIGIDTGRPPHDESFDSLEPNDELEEQTANLHDELSFLLLEGIISERGDDDGGQDTVLGRIYRSKLQRLLRWPLAKIRSERLLASLPSSFLEEHALLLGRLGRHEDALRILYVECKSLDLALQYCDARHEQNVLKEQRGIPNTEGCAYLPLVRVALRTDPDPEQSAAIQVLAMRSGSIDRAAALRLLPQSVPVSAVARPFLIPALVQSDSEIRRLMVMSALLKAKYLSLKKKLTDAQIKAQSTLSGVPQLRGLKLGEPLYSSKPYKARPSHSASSTFPEVLIIKHFFPRHLVIQAKITNSGSGVNGRSLANLGLVVAESSDEAIQPTLFVPLKLLPFESAGSAWSVLQANPGRMDIGVAVLTCELRYVVLPLLDSTGGGTPVGLMSPGSTSGGRSYVEELQDIEVQAAHFA